MTAMINSVLRSLAGQGNPQDGDYITTTIGKLSRQTAKEIGVYPKLREAQRFLKELEDEGFIYIDRGSKGIIRFDPYNRPLRIHITKKGMDYGAAADNRDIIKEQIKQEIYLVPDRQAGYPNDTPKTDRSSLELDRLDTAIMKTLVGLCDHFKKNYCSPGQQTIADRCRDWYGIKTSVRNLNRRLNYLEAAGWIKRINRNGKKQYAFWEEHGKQKSKEKGKDNIWRSTVYLLSQKVWIWGKKIQTWARKLSAFLGLPKMADYITLRGGIVTGGSSPSGGLSPILREKGAPSGIFLSDEKCRTNILRLKTLTTSIGK